MKFLSIVGTRPNFIKIAPLAHEFLQRNIPHVLVHTGQHYDYGMDKIFFDELSIPKPDINLGVGSATLTAQTAQILLKLEPVLREQKPDMVIVVGDVNSTFAGALCARQLGIPVAHVEAGLRSFDTGMPEETNRILTDHISEYLFVTEKSAIANLEREGIAGSRIFFVGNVMIDTLLMHAAKAESLPILSDLHLNKGLYLTVTMHRPSNVDDKKMLCAIADMLAAIQTNIEVVWPLHPRTRKHLESWGIFSSLKKLPNLKLIAPLGYLDFLCVMKHSAAVLTDSGGIQEETTVLGVPCITFRNNTERPVTLEKGTNLKVTTDIPTVASLLDTVINKKIKIRKQVPEKWDGKAAQRIVDILIKKT